MILMMLCYSMSNMESLGGLHKMSTIWREKEKQESKKIWEQVKGRLQLNAAITESSLTPSRLPHLSNNSTLR